MKKILLSAALLTINLLATQTIELYGDKGYPPYSYKDGSDAKGVYVDIIKSAFNKMPKYNVKFNMIAWKRAISMTKQGKAIGFFPPYYSDERTKWTKFSEPILEEKSIIFAKEKTLNNKTKFPEDFYGLTVCLNRGFGHDTVGGEKFAQAIKSGKLKLVEGNDNKACLNRVNRGIADFYINDQLIDISKFTQIKRGIKAKENFGYVGFTLKTKDYPFINDLQQKFNQVIKQMKQNGDIKKIVQRYK